MTEGGVDYSFVCVGLNSSISEAFISTRTVRLGSNIDGMERDIKTVMYMKY